MHLACFLNTQRPRFFRRYYVATLVVTRLIMPFINKGNRPAVSLMTSSVILVLILLFISFTILFMENVLRKDQYIGCIQTRQSRT